MSLAANDIGAWLWRPRQKHGAVLRLFLFPYAGAGAGAFRSWEQHLSDAIELHVVQLPGREWRRRETPHIRMEALVEDLVPIFRDAATAGPYALFGYSMGALIAFELSRRLSMQGIEAPSKLIVAACKAPHLMRQGVPIYRLPDQEFIGAIRDLGGTSSAILAEPDLLKAILPALRADFEMLGTYEYMIRPPLSLPLLVYGGTRDRHATRAQLADWRSHTTGKFALRLFNGEHFFINNVGQQVARTLVADLCDS